MPPPSVEGVPPMLRLLICDDSPEAREAVRASLTGQPEITIVGEAGNGEQAVALAAVTHPDVVLMDVQMPVLDGIGATKRIRELLPKARIVAYAGSDDSEDVMGMMGAGADAYCVKGAPVWELERAVAGASDPLVRLAHSLARSVNGGGAAELLTRELADLTGAAFTATYLASGEVALSLAALAGPGAPQWFASAPSIISRAYSELQLERADPHDLGELYRLGAACSDAVAAPLVADGQALGALLVAMRVNDRDGHAVGDEVLREVARVLMRVVRAEDEVFRIGGEEFTIVIEDASEAAADVGERVRTALAHQRRGPRLPTISAGVATFPAHAGTADDLLRKADIALYAAKFAGKDRLQIYSGEVESSRGESELLSSSAAPRLEDQGLRLLVVDDDSALRILLRTTFEVVDIEVDEADSAEAAEELIANRAPNVVVLDVGMPGMDGLTFCRRLKSDPVTADIGIVLLTGSDGGSEVAAQQAGADAYLRKPFSTLV